jgi:hypothetical protein
MSNNGDFIRQTEFVAHATAVNCLAIGQKSTQVFATGGEDAKVNVFRLGSTENIWTLTQNKSPIQCLCFDSEENYVVSGAFNGALKVFDMHVGKLARQLGSHQVAATSVQYHPYGEFLISGSEDCTMRFWDVRNKSCVETYQGHKKGITCVRFSPDGKWVASASKDGCVHFYDLIASKHIDTIRIAPATAFVTCFEFSPTELTLCAATSSRQLRCWDLETMKNTCNSPPESFVPKTFAFSNLGTSIYAAGRNSVKVWDINGNGSGDATSTGLRQTDCIDCPGWGDSVADIKVANNDQLVAASFVSNFVTTWEIDLGALASHRQESKDDERDRERERERERENKAVAPGRTPSALRGAEAKDCKDGGGRAGCSEQPQSVSAPSKSSQSGSGRDRDRFVKNMPDHDDYDDNDHNIDNDHAEDEDDWHMNDAKGDREVVPAVIHSDAHMNSGELMAASIGERFFKKFQDRQERANGDENNDDTTNDVEDNDWGRDDPLGEDDAQEQDAFGVVDEEEDRIPIDELKGLLPAVAVSGFDGDRDRERDAQLARERDSNRRSTPTAAPFAAVPSRRVVSVASGALLSPPSTSRTRQGRAAGAAMQLDLGGLEIVGGSAAVRDKPQPSSSPAMLARPMTSNNNASASVAEVQSTLDRLQSSSSSLSAVLTQRLATLRLLKGLWQTGSLVDWFDQVSALSRAASQQNAQSIAILVDFFLNIELKSTCALSLDFCVQLLTILDDMLEQTTRSSSRQSCQDVEQVVLACFRMFTELTQAFGELIRSTRSVLVMNNRDGETALHGVDLSREARLNKCNACHDVFYRAKKRVETLRHQCRQNRQVVDVLDAYLQLATIFY